jgi:hypothetical protein
MRFRADIDSTVPTGYTYSGGENFARIQRGADVYEPYAEAHYGLEADRADVSMVASDLIADLLHFAHERGEDPAAILERAARAFQGDFEDE